MQVSKISHKLSIYWRSVLMISLIMIVFLLPACTANKHGAATPDRVVEQYLQALESKDRHLMLRLVPEKSQINQAIESKIIKIGGHKIQDRQINYTKSKPTFWNARIHGSFVDRAGMKRKFDDSIAIEYQSKGQLKLYGGRWYLLLGDRSID
jgi:hypothetical protein